MDIAEGLNAGMWTVGVTKTGNGLGIPLAEVEAMPPKDLASRLQAVSDRLLGAGAHYVLEEVAQLPEVINEIAEHLARGERP